MGIRFRYQGQAQRDEVTKIIDEVERQFVANKLAEEHLL